MEDGAAGCWVGLKMWGESYFHKAMAVCHNMNIGYTAGPAQRADALPD